MLLISARHWFVGVSILIAGVASLCGAEESQGKQNKSGDSPAPATAELALPRYQNDESFARYFDAKLLGEAWASLNAELLTDCAFQLAEGERILRRNHRSVRSEEILGKALSLAYERNDRVTTERIKGYSREHGSKEFKSELSAIEELAAPSRMAAPSVDLSKLDETSKEWWSTLQRQIQAGVAFRDRGLIKCAKDEVVSGSVVPKLPKDVEGKLVAYLDGISQSLPEAIEDDPLISQLNELAGTSRGDSYLGGGGGLGYIERGNELYKKKQQQQQQPVNAVTNLYLYANGRGRFVHSGNGRWYEITATNPVGQFFFAEQRRTWNSVTLFDPSRNLAVDLIHCGQFRIYTPGRPGQVSHGPAGEFR